MVLRHSVGEYVAAFFSKACLFRQAFFLYMSAQFGFALGRRLFFRNPSLKNEGFFVFHMSGAVRLRPRVAAFFSKACLFRQAFFLYMSGAVRLRLGSPPFFVKPVF